MPALLILNYDVDDEALLADYRTRAASVLLTDGAQLVTSTAQTRHLAEAPDGGTHTVVLGFPSVEEAWDRYHSEAYQELLGQRLAATRPRAAFVVPVSGSGPFAGQQPLSRSEP